MSLCFMPSVEFKKWSCRHVEFRVLDPLDCKGNSPVKVYIVMCLFIIQWQCSALDGTIPYRIN